MAGFPSELDISIAAKTDAAECAKSKTASPIEMRKVENPNSRKCEKRDREFLDFTRDYYGPAKSASLMRSSAVIPPLLLPPLRIEKPTYGSYKTRVKITGKKITRAISGPALWRDVTDLLKLGYCSRAMPAIDANPVWVFTLRLDPSIHKRSANPINVISQRIRVQLKLALGRDVNFIGVAHIKTRSGDELHVHGLIALSENEIPAAKEALHIAGGDWRTGPGRGRQVEIKQPDASKGGAEGWLCVYGYAQANDVREYLDKQFIRMAVERQRNPEVSFVRRNSDKANDLLSAARALYEKDRAAVLAAIKATKGVCAPEVEAMVEAIKPSPVAFPAPAINDDELDADILDMLRALEEDAAKPFRHKPYVERKTVSDGFDETYMRKLKNLREDDIGGEMIELHSSGADRALTAQLEAMMAAL